MLHWGELLGKIRITVKIAGEGEKRELELDDKSAIIDVLKDTGKNPETVVVRKNGKIVPEEEILSDGDEIEVIQIVSGG